MILKNKGIIPNFYCSLPYFHWANIKCYEVGCYVVALDMETGWAVCPPVRFSKIKRKGNLEEVSIWCDFENLDGSEFCGSSEKMDYEYIYNPTQFLNIRGNNWATYRKNIRKWPKAHPNWSYSPVLTSVEALQNLFQSWVQARGGVTQIHDMDVMSSFIFDSHSYTDLYRMYLYDGEVLKGVNIWDVNYQYLNFRYTITAPDPFISEFIRHQFFTYSLILKSRKLVNDGGSLDNPSLEKFKDKLHPCQKRIRKTWTN